MFSANFEHPKVLGRFYSAHVHGMVLYSKVPCKFRGFQSRKNRSSAPKKELNPRPQFRAVFDVRCPFDHIDRRLGWRKTYPGQMFYEVTWSVCLETNDGASCHPVCQAKPYYVPQGNCPNKGPSRRSVIQRRGWSIGLCSSHHR